MGPSRALSIWRAPVLVLVSALSAAVLGGFVTSSAATGPGAFRAAKPGEPTYILSGLTVQYPYRAPQGVVDNGKVGVGYEIAWSTATYPGTAECELRVLDAEGTAIGSSRFEFSNLVPTVTSRTPLPVSVSGVPASAEGACAAATPESGAYKISNATVETGDDGATNLVADIAFGGGEPPGVGACTASLILASGAKADWAFTLQAPEGRMVIASLGSEFEGALAESVSCGPYSNADVAIGKNSA